MAQLGIIDDYPNCQVIVDCESFAINTGRRLVVIRLPVLRTLNDKQAETKNSRQQWHQSLYPNQYKASTLVTWLYSTWRASSQFQWHMTPVFTLFINSNVVDSLAYFFTTGPHVLCSVTFAKVRAFSQQKLTGIICRSVISNTATSEGTTKSQEDCKVNSCSGMVHHYSLLGSRHYHHHHHQHIIVSFCCTWSFVRYFCVVGRFRFLLFTGQRIGPLGFFGLISLIRRHRCRAVSTFTRFIQCDVHIITKGASICWWCGGCSRCCRHLEPFPMFHILILFHVLRWWWVQHQYATTFLAFGMRLWCSMSHGWNVVT